MLLKRKRNKPPALWIGLLAGWAALALSAVGAAGDDSPPAVQREFRGLWVATADNIDWPSQPGLDSARQKQELLAILDRAAALHFNVVILQVRVSCDAFYASKIEPWSEYLTGHMGRGPAPYYDPLEFAVAEAHQRGLELHAWFNPYRARLRDRRTPVAPKHVTLRHPELIRPYGEFLWLDPAEQATRDYSLSVVMDVVRRYDIDGVHFDDYFYPYPEKAGGQEKNFPDDKAWRFYREHGGPMTRADWRRDNVDRFVHEVYAAIKKEKPWVQFGISPFGIWRPLQPPQITGFDAYNELYGDSRKWLAEGWVDYLAPQLYWPVEQKAQSFPVLLQWWAGQNVRHRILLAGMKVNGWKNITDEAGEEALEIELTRRQAGAEGEILWHAKALMQNTGGVAEMLRVRPYAQPALVPDRPWLGGQAPGQPGLQARPEGGALRLTWKANGGAVWRWVLQIKVGGHWTTDILAGAKTGVNLQLGLDRIWPETVALSSVDHFGHESERAFWHPHAGEP